MSDKDYLIESRLHMLDPDLHQRFSDAIFSLLNLLSNYRNYFPEFTDHSELHAMTVINFCNQVIGEDVHRLNADELYVILMSCYLHDVGMGIRKQDFEPFSAEIDFGDYFDTHDREDIPRIIRDFHNEFSGCFIRKYKDLFDLPSEEHTFAIVQVSRGHRKTDLFDDEEYPQKLDLSNGNSICLPYLSAVLRLADELDVTAERNPMILYDISVIEDEKQIFEHKKHMAVRELDIDHESFILRVKTDEREIYEGVRDLAGKMQDTLDYCSEVVSKRSPYEITQRQILIKDL